MPLQDDFDDALANSKKLRRRTENATLPAWKRKAPQSV